MAEETERQEMLAELIAKLPEQLRPLASRYAPALLAMAKDELVTWIERLAQGDVYGAYQELIAKLPATEALTEFKQLEKQWAEAANENAQAIKVQREAISAVLRVVLAIALAMVGL